jgi:hypothetical protein
MLENVTVSLWKGIVPHGFHKLTVAFPSINVELIIWNA